MQSCCDHTSFSTRKLVTCVCTATDDCINLLSSGPFLIVFDDVQYICVIIFSNYFLSLSQFLVLIINLFFNLPPLKIIISMLPLHMLQNVNSNMENGRGRKGELREADDIESNCGMVTELQTPRKSQCAFTQVQSPPERTQSHFSRSGNMKTEHVSGIGLDSEAKSRDAAS